MRLWTSAQPTVANYVHALVRDHSAAKDVLQETAMVLFRRFADYDSDRPFVSWALGIARFQVLGLHRDAARSLVTFDEELLERFTESWAEAPASVTDRAAALQPCMERLAAHAKRLVRLRYFEGMNSDEIARETGGNGAAVRVALQRIREQLRACVERQLQPQRGNA